MPLTFQVLGQPGRDNALFVKLDSGQGITRLLFDCGEGCPHQLPFAEVAAIDHLFFSHLHVDHVAGFDSVFRLIFDRAQKENHVWVPMGSAGVIHHRFQGFTWNLVNENQPGTWFVHEIGLDVVRTFRVEAKEAFRTAHLHSEEPRTSVVVAGLGYTVEAHVLDHGIPSLGFVVREATRVNVDVEKMTARGLAPGPWVKRLRGPTATPGETVRVGNAEIPLPALQAELLIATPGESIAYLTDFRLNAATADYLVEYLRGVTTVVCESQYRTADRELAEKVMHSVVDEVATLAARAEVGKLILFHLSDRYLGEDRKAILAEARAIFPRTSFPEGWGIEGC